MKKRQEIGRGLRLPVDQDGTRVFDEAINKLYVMANESYEDFARALQTEMPDTIVNVCEQSLRAREAEAKCGHVWIFEATTLSTASPATMRHVRCIPDGTKVPTVPRIRSA
jgi:hypothetical protein